MIGIASNWLCRFELGGRELLTPARQNKPPCTLDPKAKALFQSCQRMLGAVDGNLPWPAEASSSASGQGSVFMVISAASGEGRTTAAASMGWALGPVARTLLVDAHTEVAGLSALFGVDHEPGLTEVLCDQAEPDDLVRLTERAGLHILPAGNTSDSAAAVYRQSGFTDVLGRLRRDWDRIIFDTPPFLDQPDASVLARHMDGAVLVVSSEETHRAVASLVKERLESAQGALVGVVLNQRRLHIPNWIYRAL